MFNLEAAFNETAIRLNSIGSSGAELPVVDRYKGNRPYNAILYHARKAVGLGQDQLGRLCGWQDGQILRQYENLTHKPGPEATQRIADGLKSAGIAIEPGQLFPEWIYFLKENKNSQDEDVIKQPRFDLDFDRVVDPQDTAERNEWVKKGYGLLIEHLTQRQIEALKLRFEGEKMTLQEIAKEMGGVTREDIRKIIWRASRKITEDFPVSNVSQEENPCV